MKQHNFFELAELIYGNKKAAAVLANPTLDEKELDVQVAIEEQPDHWEVERAAAEKERLEKQRRRFGDAMSDWLEEGRQHGKART